MHPSWAGALPESQGMPSPLRKGLASCLSVHLSLPILSTIHSQFTACIPGVQAHLSLVQSTYLLQLGHPTEAPAGPSMGDESLMLTAIELAQDKVGKHQSPSSMFLSL